MSAQNSMFAVTHVYFKKKNSYSWKSWLSFTIKWPQYNFSSVQSFIIRIFLYTLVVAIQSASVYAING